MHQGADKDNRHRHLGTLTRQPSYWRGVARQTSRADCYRSVTTYKDVTAMLQMAFAPWSKQPAFVPWTAASQRRRPLWMPHSSPMQANVSITKSAAYECCGHRLVPLHSPYA